MAIDHEQPFGREQNHLQMLQALPVAIYTTDAAGKVTFYNQAAVDLAGRIPQIGTDEWCVTWRLYEVDGRPLPHDACPMAVALKEKRPVRGQEAVAERPDGTRIPFRAYPTPLYSSAGELAGAINLLMDISNEKRLHAEAQRVREFLVAQRSSSSLDGIIGCLHEVIASDADPYLLAGALVESVAVTIAQRISPELQGEVSVETVRLLRDRMLDHGLI